MRRQIRFDNCAAKTRHRYERGDPGRNLSESLLRCMTPRPDQLLRSVSIPAAIAFHTSKREGFAVTMVHSCTIEKAAAWTGNGVIVQSAHQSKVAGLGHPRQGRGEGLCPSMEVDDRISVIQLGKAAKQKASGGEVPGHQPLRGESSRIGTDFALASIDYLDTTRGK